MTLELDAVGIEPAILGHGHGTNRLATGQVWQVTLLLLVRPSKQQCFGYKIAARSQGHTGQSPAHFLGHHAGFQVAKATAAILLGDSQADPAILGHLLPQRLIEISLGVIHDLVDALHGRALRQQATRRITDHFLVFRKSKIHELHPPCVVIL
jgi:hypothetical protein